MASKNSALLCMLQILYKYSDDEHYLLQEDIIRIMKEEYNITCERKSIGEYTKQLEELGFNVIKEPRKGIHIDKILYPSEVYFLMDQVIANKTIDETQTNRLNDQLSNLLSKYEKEERKIENAISKSIRNKSKSNALLFTISQIRIAIKKKKKISLKYENPTLNKDFKREEFVVNPKFLISTQGRNYLVCYYDNKDTLYNYKLEYIKKVSILETAITPYETISKDGLDISLEQYTEEHIYPLSGETVDATIKLINESAYAPLVDWYGYKTKVEKHEDGYYYADVKVNENSLVIWALQFGDIVEVISPESTIAKINKKIDNLASIYSNKKE